MPAALNMAGQPPFRAGVVGCGNIGSRYDEREPDGRIFTHAGMYAALEGFDLVGAAEPDARRREAFGRFWKTPRLYRTHREMFAAEALDIVSIATPDETHADIISDALRCERPPRLLFCEKPLAHSAAHAAALCREARRRQVVLCVDYIRRWDENHRRLKAWIQGGGLGSVEAVNGYYVRGLRHNGCQMINLIRYFFGGVETVQATGPVRLGSFPGDPSLDLCLKMESGLRAHMTALDQGGYGFSIFELDIFGRRGRVRIFDGGQQAQIFRAVPDPQFPNFNRLEPGEFAWDEQAYAQALRVAGRQMAACLSAAGRPPENEALEAAADLSVIEAAWASAEAGGRPHTVTPSLS